MASSWGPKLEAKLESLTDTASSESIQAVCKWIGFNRKHTDVIASVILDQLASSTEKRQSLYWKVVDQVLAQDHGTPKWDRMAELRSALGEKTIIPALEKGYFSDASALETMMKEWNDRDCFGGPTHVSQMRRVLNSKAGGSGEAVKAEPSAAPAASTTTSEASIKEDPVAAQPPEDKTKLEEVKPKKDPILDIESKLSQDGPKKTGLERRTSLSNAQTVDYDFESKVCKIICVESFCLYPY